MPLEDETFRSRLGRERKELPLPARALEGFGETYRTPAQDGFAGNTMCALLIGLGLQIVVCEQFESELNRISPDSIRLENETKLLNFQYNFWGEKTTEKVLISPILGVNM